MTALSRRRMLGTTLAGLALGGSLGGRVRAQAAIPSLELIEPLGEPSVIWTAFSYLRPVLAEKLGCDVSLRTVTGDGNLNAYDAMVAAEGAGVRLMGMALMATQYAGLADGYRLKVDDLTPIAKLSNGFSIALFTRREGGLADWDGAIAAAKGEPLTVSCLPEATAAWVAKLMLERRAGLAMTVTVRDTLGEVIEDVTSGRSAAGLIPTALVARDRAHLKGLVTFGAERNAVLFETPTFEEVSGQEKMSFTESIAAFGPPGMEPEVAAELAVAFVAAGLAPAIQATQESTLFPVVVNGPEILVEAMARNRRVLDDILA